MIQHVEGNLLIQRIMSYSVDVSPPTVILGILGPAGAFLAVPMVAAIQVILNDTPRPALEEDGLLWGSRSRHQTADHWRPSALVR